MTTLVACGIAVAALSWFLVRRLGIQRRELKEAEERLGRRIYRVQGRLAEIESLVRELEFEKKRLRGEIRIEAGMKIEEAFEIHPRVREILGTYGISGGGCSGGSLDEGVSIRDACALASVDPAAVLDSLRRFVADPRAVNTPEIARSAKLYSIGKSPLGPSA